MIRGTRIPVKLILRKLAAKTPIAEILLDTRAFLFDRNQLFKEFIRCKLGGVWPTCCFSSVTRASWTSRNQISPG